MTDVEGGESTEEDDEELSEEDHNDEVYGDEDDNDQQGPDDGSEENEDEEAESADEDEEEYQQDEDEEDEEERHWAPKEEMVAGGIITDPRPVISTSKPGPGARDERKKLAERFWTKWERKASSNMTDEEEDVALLIHAVRHGVTPEAIYNKKVLKTGDRNKPSEVAYRIKQLKGKRVDLTPRTREQAWKVTKARTTSRTPRQQEAETLKAAIQRGNTLEQIVASGIVTLSTNTRRAIRKRWDDWLRLGEDLPALPS